ncbi:ATP-binding protein [Streptomyces sp. NPDC059193]|uniref:ATP-binding protein n=1 Tax=Streptomyces sp. NPDC059193 TaxID=3346763 RepID=UPI0036738702
MTATPIRTTSVSLFRERVDAVEERLRRLYIRHETGVPADEPPETDEEYDGYEAGEADQTYEADEADHADHPDGEDRRDRPRPSRDRPRTRPRWPDAGQLAELDAQGDRLARLVRRFDLTERETDLLLTCLLPELDPVCGTAFRFLSGRPSSRPTVSVALSTHGITVSEAVAAGLLRPGSPLLEAGLLVYEDPSEAFPDRLLQIPGRLVDFLVGRHGGPEAGGPSWLRILPAYPEAAHGADPEHTTALCDALGQDRDRTRYLRQGIRGEALPAAREALATHGLVPLLLDPEAFAAAAVGTPPSRLAEQTALEARLLGAAVLLPVPPPGTATPERTDMLRHIASHLDAAPLPLLLYGAQPWSAFEWDAPLPAETDLRSAVARHPRDQIGAAASATVERLHRSYALRARTPAMPEVRAAARLRAAAELGSLARRIEPAVGWQDLILPGAVRRRLDMLVARVRHREDVFREWGMRRGGGRGQGTAALFAGESGTGKTMGAEAVAHELGLDLYVISLPSIVSKYIGETEKNLERVFSAAEALQAVVLFDEADSMFAKRGEVKGSNDRHANMQSGYLLQRLEAFNGLAILTTNLRSNIDSAFTRRFDEVVHFESPGPDVRAQLWRGLLGDAAPADLPVDVLAQAYDLAGGSIRACVESAAFEAAAAGRPVNGEDLLAGIETEYTKLGRLFGRVG